MSKTEYEAKNPKCTCDGLEVILKMARVYKDYAQIRSILNNPKAIQATAEAKERALEVTKNLLEKLKPEDAQTERAKDWLQRSRAEALACEKEKDGCLMALEWVRASIHDDYALRAKLTCQKWKPGLGFEFIEKQPYDAISWAMYGIAGFGKLSVDTAIEELEKAKKKHGCV